MTLRLLPLVLVALALTACGGGAGEPASKATPAPTPTGISEVDANALPLNTPRATIIRRFGRPFDPQGIVPPKIISGTPKNVTRCDYFHVRGGKPKDFIQFCFRGGVLQSKLSLVTPVATQ